MRQYIVRRNTTGDTVLISNSRGALITQVAMLDNYETTKSVIIAKVKELATGKMFMINSCPFDSKGVRL